MYTIWWRAPVLIVQCSLVFFFCLMSWRENELNSPLQHFPVAKFDQSLAEWRTVHSKHSHWMLHLHPPVTDAGRALLTHSSSTLHLNNSSILCSTSPSCWPWGIFNAVAQQCLTLHCNTASVSLCNQRKDGISARTGGHDGLATAVFLFWLGPWSVWGMVCGWRVLTDAVGGMMDWWFPCWSWRKEAEQKMGTVWEWRASSETCCCCCCCCC